MRLLLGMGESIAFPSYSRILATQYPEHHRGFANAIVDAGTKIGPALGTLLGGLLMARFGWRACSSSRSGCVSLLWLVPWFRWMPRGDQGGSPRAARRPGRDPEILSKRSAWFSALALFCSNYFWYFLVTWLPPISNASAISRSPRWRCSARFPTSRSRSRRCSAAGSRIT